MYRRFGRESERNGAVIQPRKAEVISNEPSKSAKKLLTLIAEKREPEEIFCMWDIRGWKNPDRPVDALQIAEWQVGLEELELKGLVRKKIYPQSMMHKKCEYFLTGKK